jgi:hypothetical protein
MKPIYLLASDTLDVEFGFRLAMRQMLVPEDMTCQAAKIINMLKAEFEMQPLIGTVLVADEVRENKYAALLRISGKRQLHFSGYSMGADPRNREYEKTLTYYVTRNSPEDNIVIARREIAKSINQDLERLVGADNLKLAIYPPHA